MWQRLHTRNQGAKTGTVLGLVREENGGGREAKEESVEGRMVEFRCLILYFSLEFF